MARTVAGEVVRIIARRDRRNTILKKIMSEKPGESGFYEAVRIYVQDDEPTGIPVKTIWIDTNDYSRYGITELTGATVLEVDDDEVITCSGTFSVTLHVGTAAGVIKKIYNVGAGIITIVGTINGIENMYLYPGESAMLVTDGTNWRY